MSFFRDLFGLPPAQPQVPATKQEKPVDPDKVAMRELAGEIKGLEAQIGRYEDVDLNSSEGGKRLKKEITIGGKNAQELEKDLEGKGYIISDQAKEMMASKDFKPEVEGNAKRQARGELKKVSREIREKENRRELVSQIKEMEAEIGAYEDVDELGFRGTESSQRMNKDMRKALKDRPQAKRREAIAEIKRLEAEIGQFDDVDILNSTEAPIKDFEPEAEVKTKRRARGELKKNARAQRKQPLAENVIAKKDLATKEGWKKRAEIKQVLKEIEKQEEAIGKLSE